MGIVHALVVGSFDSVCLCAARAAGGAVSPSVHGALGATAGAGQRDEGGVGERSGEAEAGDADGRRTGGGITGAILSGCDHFSEATAEEKTREKDWTLLVKRQWTQTDKSFLKQYK